MTKTATLQKCVQMLMKAPRTREYLMDTLGVDNRTLTRYLTEIPSYGHKLNQVRKSASRTIHYSIESARLPLSGDDIRLLQKVRDNIEKEGNMDLLKAMELFINKTRTMVDEEKEEAFYDFLKGEGYFSFYPGPNENRKVKNKVPEVLHNAARNHQVLEITYKKPDADSPTRFPFHPYGLSHRSGRLYCAGFRPDLDTPMPLNLNRISFIRSTGAMFDPPVLTLKELYRHSFGAYMHKSAVRVVIKLNTPWIINYLDECRVHETAEIVKQGNETLLTMKVGIDDELGSWVLSWGKKMTVVEPVQLKECIRKLHQL